MIEILPYFLKKYKNFSIHVDKQLYNDIISIEKLL